MALIADDKVHCKKCGGVEFLEEKKVIIHSDVEKNSTIQDIMGEFGIPERYLHSSKVVYICTSCGEELSY